MKREIIELTEGKVYINYEKGICSYCGHDILNMNYMINDVTDPSYEFECGRCGNKGTEVYKFSHNEIAIKNKEE